MADQPQNNTFQYWLGSENPYTSPAGSWPGIEKAGKQWIWAAYKNLYGREPTAVELAAGMPAAVNGPEQAQAFVAQQYQTEQNDPLKLQQKQQQEYLAKAPEHYGAVDEQFKSLIGREATQAEKDHFGSLLAAGTLDPYALTQFLQAQPEYTQKQDTAFQESQRAGLEKADTTYYQQTLLPAIQRQLLQSGRSLESSGFAGSLAQAAKQQSQEREKYLTSLAASQYQGRTGQSYQDYVNNQNQFYNTQNYNTQRAAQLQDMATARLNEISNFNMQKQAYDEYLRKYGKRSNGGGIGALAGGLLGAGLGFGLAGPGGGAAGAQAGYLIGSGTGGAAGSLWGQ